MDSLVASPIPKSRGGVNDDSFVHHNSPSRVGGATSGNSGAVSSITLLESLRGEKEEQARWRAVREAYQEPELQEVPMWLAALHAKKRLPKPATVADPTSSFQDNSAPASALDTRSLMEVLADSLSDGHKSIDTPEVAPVLTSATAAWMRSMTLQKSQRSEVEVDDEGRPEKPFNSEWLRLLANSTASNV